MHKIIDDFGMNSQISWEGKLERGCGSFPDGRTAGSVSGRIAAKFDSNWSGYRSLRFTLYNPWDRPVTCGFEIYDTKALESAELQYGDFIDRSASLLICEGINHVVVFVDPIITNQGTRYLDLNNIAGISIIVPEPNPGEKPISISDLRLSREDGDTDSVSGAVPGDSVLLVKHLDLKCYTYKPEEYEETNYITELTGTLKKERERLEKLISCAEINGKQTHYQHAALVAADIALNSRPLLAWHFSQRAKAANMTEAITIVREQTEFLQNILSSRTHEDDEDDSNLSMSLVKPVPDLKTLKVKGRHFVDDTDKPVLLCAMSYHNEGALMRYFTPERHKLELFAVGGGSRYDIEWSPVYKVFHRYEGAKRVGWRGWCGHLIKDQWAMGGRKENVVICLENEKILDAIEQYNRIHACEWRNDSSLVYVILGYELTYMCYCDESIRRFRQWLSEKHKDINELNKKWNTSYKSFDEAQPPASEGFGPAPDTNRAAWFDWAVWNMRRFTDHLKWSKASIRRIHPDIPICAGGTASMLSPANGTSGIDEELIINEVDDVILHEGSDILGVDLLQALSAKEKPMVDPEQGGDCSGWLHNYLHGKSTIAMFCWPKQPSRQFPGTTLAAPVQGTMSIRHVVEHLNTALDIRRLKDEIIAFWDLPKEVAVLYSKTSMIQIDPKLITANSTPYLLSMRRSYDTARCLDAGTTFISEKQLLEGKGNCFRLVIVPSVKNLPRNVFKALDEYVLAGGNMLVIPEALMRDEYDAPADYLKEWGITIRNTFSPDIAAIGGLEQKYDQNLQRNISFESGMEIHAAKFGNCMEEFTLTISGLFQKIEAANGTIAATGPEDETLLVCVERGRGKVWYLAGTPDQKSLLKLLDILYDETGVTRHLKVVDNDGERVGGLEARLVRREFDDLVYIVNGSGADVEFIIETDRPYHMIRELRSLKYYPGPSGKIKKDDVLIFSFKENPQVKICF